MGIAADTTEVVTQPAHGLSLRRNFAWTVLGNVTYAACQWGMLVALARLGSPEMVGQFALGLAIGAPVTMLANLQLRAAQATDARNEYRFGEYLGLRFLTTTLAFGVVCLIAWLGGYRPAPLSRGDPFLTKGWRSAVRAASSASSCIASPISIFLSPRMYWFSL